MDFLEDEAWNEVQHLFVLPPRSGRGRRPVDARAIMSAILWVLSHDGRWVHLPRHFPSQQTCYQRYREWRADGRLFQALDILRAGYFQQQSKPLKIEQAIEFSEAATGFS